jgi:CRISPR-associated protein (TIGR03986 family)
MNRRQNETGRPASALYNFVPLPERVFVPDDKEEDISHDVPFKDGYCGEIPFEIVAETPLAVGGEQKQGTEKEPGLKEFYRDPEDNPAIPGSSVKGMVRAVLEIASFGRMGGRIDVRRFGLRNLHSNDYLGKMRGVQAGFLFHDGEEGWKIRPCEYAYVSHEELWKDPEKRKQFGRRPEQKEEPLKKKYDLWKMHHGGNLHRNYSLSDKEIFNNGKCVGKRSVATLRDGDGGLLVFTGQPADAIRKDGSVNESAKKYEFLFYGGEEAEPLPVSEKTMGAFRDVYEGGTEGQGNNCGSGWAWRQKRYRNKKEDEEIPVFFHTKDGKGKEVSSFGLSLMYKFPYKRSTRDCLPPAHKNPEGAVLKYDLADRIFGYVDGDKALKGRAGFSLGRLQAGEGGAKAEVPKTVPMVLGQPRASYVLNYLKDGTTTYEGDARLRGWKRYPVRPEAKPEPLGAAAGNKKVQACLETVKKGTRFAGVLRFHNLRPYELGALLWAMRFGQKPGEPNPYRHALGGGKAHGYGQVRLETDCKGARIVANDGAENVPASDPEAICRKAMEAFETRMEEFMNECPAAAPQPAGSGHFAALETFAASLKPKNRWRAGAQIAALLAMARPENAEGNEKNGVLKAMVLDPERKINQFHGKDDGAKAPLPAYQDFLGGKR